MAHVTVSIDTIVTVNANLPDLELKIISPDHVELIIDQADGGKYCRPIATGGYADVYKALLRKGGPDSKPVEVVVKVLRDAHIKFNTKDKADQYIKRIRREYGVWGDLSHPNIVELAGVVHHPSLPSPGFVSAYKPYMDLLNFMQGNNNYDRILMVQGIACGLAYLHERQVVHGDLTAPNILVDRDVEGTFVPLISDFGKSKIIGASGYTTNVGVTPALVQPPELLAHGIDEPVGEAATNKSVLVPASDVYSMSLVFVEVLTGKAAFSEERTPAWQTIPKIVYSRLRPNREKYPMLDGSYEYIWPIMEGCWEHGPSERLSSAEAYRRLCQPEVQDPPRSPHGKN